MNGTPAAEPASSGRQVPQVHTGLPQIQEELKRIEPDTKKRDRILAVFESHSITHRGPLPSPDSLRQYEQIVPGLAERIVKMAENQSSHRMDLEQKVVNDQLGESKRGQYFGFAIAVICLVATLYLALQNHDTVAGILGGTTIVGLVTVFVLGKREQKENLSNKSNT
jgi:uncharacterized membrane protein